jgi:hypothetical protein
MDRRFCYKGIAGEDDAKLLFIDLGCKPNPDFNFQNSGWIP